MFKTTCWLDETVELGLASFDDIGLALFNLGKFGAGLLLGLLGSPILCLCFVVGLAARLCQQQPQPPSVPKASSPQF